MDVRIPAGGPELQGVLEVPQGARGVVAFSRLAHAARFVAAHQATRGLPVGLFGASTGAASALRVAAAMPQTVRAVVSHGGRPDLAGPTVLARVQAPTLLLVGAEDHGVIELNEAARDALVHCTRELRRLPGWRATCASAACASCTSAAWRATTASPGARPTCAPQASRWRSSKKAAGRSALERL